jgi:hypothetical protein
MAQCPCHQQTIVGHSGARCGRAAPFLEALCRS